MGKSKAIPNKEISNNEPKSIRERIEAGMQEMGEDKTGFRQHSHPANWSQPSQKPETYAELMQRWDVIIADSKLAKDKFERLKSEYLKKIDNGAKKESLIQRDIDKYNLTKMPKRLEDGFMLKDGFMSKGYIWFEDASDFSLKDFVLYHPETISEQVYDEKKAVILDGRCIDTYVEQGQKRTEISFACEGYAYAKYVDFLETELLGKSPGVLKLRPQTLKEIFINDAAYLECMDALKNVNPPIISFDNRYLLGPKQKGAFTAWREVVENAGKIKTGITRKDMPKLLNIEIEGLNLGEDAATLYRTYTTQYNYYKRLLAKLIV